MVIKVDKWKLMHCELQCTSRSDRIFSLTSAVNELEKWHNESATVAFLGDACHPMLPYLAQGAGSSLEDGAALGILLSEANTREDLPRLLKLYEQLRKPRSSALQRRSMTQVCGHHSFFGKCKPINLRAATHEPPSQRIRTASKRFFIRTAVQ